ncbi:MAG: bifunctional (p)ppGpp synthetase/guanosine-3',5'-bis(diphosphate) 3'-pyrophosphohydrolase [Clostridia bacterium]
MDDLFNRLLNQINENFSEHDIKKIKKAYALASMAHIDQVRDSGEPYITHPVNVALILSDFDPDANTIAAALLHDVVEDTPIAYRDIKKEFGVEVADLVEGVTKLGLIEYSSKEEQQIENIRKMILATAKDVRVLLIKLADRLHNMRTIGARVQSKRLATSLETMEVYAPLAHRLGIQKIKIELEDLALYQLDPVAYNEIKTTLDSKLSQKEDLLATTTASIEQHLKDVNIEYVIESRFKQIYSIYRKMYTQNREFDEIYDLFALRIIVNSVSECYAVLGIIHDEFHPIPGRFKDYISTPKPNKYQSLHTTVIGKDGVPFEVQIRTAEMHRIAEYGIAAHWRYKTGIFDNDINDEKLAWIRQLLELQNDATEPEEFMRALKIDMFADEVFVFTPNGDIINLPLGATPIDFAYSIHSAVGNKMTGAKVNGKIVELTYVLKNGDRCEIITASGEHSPNRDWIKLAKTSEARNKIRQWFKKERREENVETGYRELESELKRNNIHFTEHDKSEILKPVYERLSMSSLDDFYAAIGYGGIFVSKIMPRMRDEYAKRVAAETENKGDPSFINNKEIHTSTNGITVEGIDNCLIKFSQCCTPVPGDLVVGFITRGYGVSIHKSDCKNLQKLIELEPERIVDVKWDTKHIEQFDAIVNITAQNRIGLAADITSNLASMRVMIRSLNARELTNGDALITVNIIVRDFEHLKSVINKLEKINGVVTVTR